MTIWHRMALNIDGQAMAAVIPSVSRTLSPTVGWRSRDYARDDNQDGTPRHEGYIAIQAESHGTDFKTIEYRPLR